MAAKGGDEHVVARLDTWKYVFQWMLASFVDQTDFEKSFPLPLPGKPDLSIFPWHEAVCQDAVENWEKKAREAIPLRVLAVA
jgi:hypothetical protein